MKRSTKAFIYALLAVTLWGTIPTAFKIALGGLSVVTMVGITTFVSTAVLLVIMAASGKLALLRDTTPAEMGWSALLGLINPVIYYIILLNAYSRLPGQVAQPINMIWPIILVFFSIPLLKQRIPARSFLALAISLAGVYIIASQGAPFRPGRSDPAGVMLALASSILWALYFVLNVRDRRDESVKLFTNFMFGSLYMVIIMAATGAFSFGSGWKPLAAAVYCGFFEMGITFWLWLRALHLAETTDKVSNLVYLAPLISLVLLHFIIDEPVYYTTLIGLLLIAGSILYQNRPRQGKTTAR